ncbi:MAG: UDP-N-acetylmuramoyl-L-alanyl-D-glutamate--2,6-diaminopimelate ligase [Christensenellaceae bacterium]|nr:UDP-N-acetylmuramoyl-L-alanyl-D-glutamate--2,6-diaminopimelate ligase [Christensenellaceae bacterium]
MDLRKLMAEVAGIEGFDGDDSVEITGLSYDSRKAGKGFLHFCLPGQKVDGHDFAAQAAENGAAALVVERRLPIGLPQVLVKDARKAMSYFAQAFYGHPAKDMICVGITGTKGKTTSSYLIASIAKAAGHKVGLVGTVVTRIGEEEEEASLTTPEAIELQALLARMRDAGCSFFVMEVSAHALAQERLAGMVFDAGLFTNLSQDHLDYFHTMENYKLAKKRFFSAEYIKRAIVNLDDDAGAEMTDGKVPVTGFAVAGRAGVQACAEDIEIQESGVSYTLRYKSLAAEIRMRFSGIFNVYNSLGAAVTCLELGVPMSAVRSGIQAVAVVPGRIEPLQTSTPYRVILDYAHSPAALENILETIRQFTQGRLICVFGCGGGRDKEKRPLMGGISGRLADYSILTSDNPRYEEPTEILSAIERGIAPTGGPYRVIENRREAIAEALKMGQKGDIIVLAGKGHETYQEVAGIKRPFDEKQVVAELLSEMGLD